jgi:sporulation protein YlmC with PRC-barrel domain
MGYSANKYRKEREERRWKINPVWRGIGCVIILLIPFMSWYGAMYFIQTNQLFALPKELIKTFTIPYTHVSQIDKIIMAINQFADMNNLIYGQFFFTIILMFLGFGVLSVVYAVMYRVAGPPRYGPYDVPPDYMRR